MAPDSPVPSFPTAWRTVSFGTICLSAGAVVLVLGVLAFSTLITFSAELTQAPTVEGLENRARELPSLSILGCLLVLFTGAMLCLAGLCQLCVAPAESGTRPLAWGATVCWFLFLVVMMQIPLTSVGVIVRPPRFADVRRNPEPGLVRMTYGSDGGSALAGAVLAIVGGSLTMGFVCAVAHRFKNENLARSARWLLVYGIMTLPSIVMVSLVHSFVTETQTGRHLAWYYNLLPFAAAYVGLLVVGCVWLLRVFAEMRRMLRSAEEIAAEQTRVD